MSEEQVVYPSLISEHTLRNAQLGTLLATKQSLQDELTHREIAAKDRIKDASARYNEILALLGKPAQLSFDFEGE